MVRDRRRFVAEMLSLGAAAIGCSAGSRDLSLPDTGTIDSAPEDARLVCPEGSTGLLPGMILKSFAMTGLRGSRGSFVPLEVCEYYDPDGSRGINALWVIRTAAWCVPCQDLAKRLRDAAPPYLARGVRIVEVFESGSSEKSPATDATINTWVETYGSVWDIAHTEPGVLEITNGGFPTSFFVDPRSLVISSTFNGSNVISSTGRCSRLDTVLAANGA